MTDRWEDIVEEINSAEKPEETAETAERAEETAEQAPEETPAEKPEKKETLLSSAYDMLANLVTAFILVTVVLCFCFRLVDVDGTSMWDTLQNEDRLILRIALYTPEKGDIVVLYQERDPEKPLIKRVIATAGDTLRLDPEQNQVWLKAAGESEFTLLKEPYVHYPLSWGASWNDGDILVPEGQVFVMGDHRNLSNDSRYLGCFPVEDVVGKAIFRLLPLSGFGTL